MSEWVRAHEAPVVNVPVRGTWKLIESRGREKFAFDLVAASSDRDQTRGKSRVEAFLDRANGGDSYDKSMLVYAPITGTVVRADDSRSDRQRFSLLRDVWAIVSSRSRSEPDDIGRFAANHVIIQGAGSYAVLAHIQHRSLQVAEGDEVEAGQVIARVGNSGFVLGPHLHFQLFDQIDDFLAAAAVPFLVSEYERWTGGGWEQVRYAALRKGELMKAMPGSQIS